MHQTHTAGHQTHTAGHQATPQVQPGAAALPANAMVRSTYPFHVVVTSCLQACVHARMCEEHDSFNFKCAHALHGCEGVLSCNCDYALPGMLLFALDRRRHDLDAHMQVLGQKRGREGEQVQDDDAAKRARGEVTSAGAVTGAPMQQAQALTWKYFLDLEVSPSGAPQGLLIDKMKALAASLDKEKGMGGLGAEMAIDKRAAEMVSEACEIRIRQVIDALASIACVHLFAHILCVVCCLLLTSIMS